VEGVSDHELQFFVMGLYLSIVENIFLRVFIYQEHTSEPGNLCMCYVAMVDVCTWLLGGIKYLGTTLCVRRNGAG